MDNLITIKNLTKNYESFKLDNVSFDVPAGAIMGLIGENGAGKSTTIKCILNLIRRDGGEISVFGRDNIKDERAIKEHVGVVLDESTFHDTLRTENVGAIMANVYKNWDGALFERYLKKFGLPSNITLKQFSRGMKMKLSIAAALAPRPRLLILDEATSGLDPVVRNEILDEFLEFIQDEEHSILISSHITSDLEKVADYVTYLHRGKVAITGGKDELLESHGRLVCTREELDRVEKEYIVGRHVSQFGCEALIRGREEFKLRWPKLTVDPVTLEEIMVFTVKGEQE